MAQPSQDNLALQVYIKEYDRLKSEQTQRLGFRDNLIYANLIAMTAILSISATDVVKVLVLLLLPMVSVVLGWTYLVNDEKISAIGRYVRNTLSDKVREAIQSKDQDLFGWEVAHRSDERRMSRKIIQLVVDELVFVLPGFVAILMFWINAPDILLPLRGLAGVEGVLLGILGWQIFSYADLLKGK